MTREALEARIQELFSVIASAFSNKAYLPGLILLYSCVDIMAWLDLPSDREDVRGSDFIRWVEQNLLPGSGLLCKGVDLYGARCALIHSYTSESRLTRQKEAREVYYAWGTARAQDLQMTVDHLGRNAVTVHIDNLFEALKRGAGRFLQSLSNDPSHANRVDARAAKFFAPISPELVSDAIEAMKERESKSHGAPWYGAED